MHAEWARHMPYWACTALRAVHMHLMQWKQKVRVLSCRRCALLPCYAQAVTALCWVRIFHCSIHAALPRPPAPYLPPLQYSRSPPPPPPLLRPPELGRWMLSAEIPNIPCTAPNTLCISPNIPYPELHRILKRSRLLNHTFTHTTFAGGWGLWLPSPGRQRQRACVGWEGTWRAFGQGWRGRLGGSAGSVGRVGWQEVTSRVGWMAW